MSWQPELAAAREAALAAGMILRRHFEDDSFQVGSKGHDNPVTNADLEADQAIKDILMRKFPADGWLSEETADSPERLSRRRVWIVDPLDGTKEFITHVPEFAVAIALAEDGIPVVGVTYNPIKDELFWSARGTGCYLGEHRISVSQTRDLKQARLLASRSEIKRGEWQPFEDLARVAPTGSVAYKLALIAAGAGDATLSRTPKSEWDIASGIALVNEAGGRATDIKGGELRFNQLHVLLPGIIVSNGCLHQELVDLVERIGTSPEQR